MAGPAEGDGLIHGAPDHPVTETRFLMACNAGQAHIVRDMLAQGVSPDCRLHGKKGETGLHLLSRLPEGPAQLQTAQALFGAGASVNLRSGKGKATALHRAAFYGAVALAEVLVQAGADVHARDGSKTAKTPLLIAVERHHVQMAQFLIEQGGDVTYHGSGKANHGLIYAAGPGTVDMLRLLLDAGSPVGMQCMFGDSPLHKAAYHMRFDSIVLLLAAGADPCVQNRQGQSPSDVAKASLSQPGPKPDRWDRILPLLHKAAAWSRRRATLRLKYQVARGAE